MVEKYFPQGLAYHDNFCNRDKERQAIKESIAAGEHLVLIAPRRYGKSSLIAKVLEENDFANTNIDLFFALNQSDVNKTIAEHISKVISDILPKTQATARKIISSIAELSPKLAVNLLGPAIEIHPTQKHEKSISELLLALDHVAQKTKKNCVVVLDEFQQIGELKENHAIEAAIRHAVERSKNVSYIFCGSKQHLLSEMFSDKSRPLYHLCDLMIIERIANSDYQPFLKKLAQQKWKSTITDDTIDEILYLTENHPYYVNALCRKLWKKDTLPTLQQTRQAWDKLVKQQSAWIIDDISRLTLNRRKLLLTLAQQTTNEPQGQKFSHRIKLTPSIIKKTLADCQKMDLVYRDKQGNYQIVDPAISYFIRQNYSVNAL